MLLNGNPRNGLGGFRPILENAGKVDSVYTDRVSAPPYDGHYTFGANTVAD